MPTNSQESNARTLDRICQLWKTSYFYEELNNLTALFTHKGQTCCYLPYILVNFGRFEQSYIQYYVIDIKGSIGHCLKRHRLKRNLIIRDHTIIPEIY